MLNRVRRWRLRAAVPVAMAGGGASDGGAGDSGALTGASRADGSAGRSLPFSLPADVTSRSVKRHGGCIVASINPAVTREEALALKGAEVLVDRADFPPADADEYYWADLIGCRVADPVGAELGTVVAVDDHGAQSVLRLDGGILIPFVSAVVLEVRAADKRIIADWSADWV